MILLAYATAGLIYVAQDLRLPAAQRPTYTYRTSQMVTTAACWLPAALWMLATLPAQRIAWLRRCALPFAVLTLLTAI